MAKVPTKTGQRHFVREWRKYRGLTQEQLAERIGKTHGAISQLENGKIDYTQAMLEALAGALHCEPGDLLRINPEADGDLLDLTALLRGTSDAVKKQALAVVTTLLQTTGSAPSGAPVTRPAAERREGRGERRRQEETSD